MLLPLIGHERPLSQLHHLLEGGRFPHALLLHGPKGIGKRLLAEHLAWRLILGPQAPLPLAGDLPEACRGLAAQIESGACADYHVLACLEDKKSISIKQVREILEILLRSADTARVVVVDALEDLTPEAANTLLKTLEEPRPGIYFVMVCHQLHAVLPTLRSRSRLMPCHPLSDAETARVLAKLGLSAQLAPLAHGAPGTVAGEGGKARAKVLDTLAAGELPAATEPELLPALLQHLAGQKPSLATAEAYAKIAQLLVRKQELNLPAALAHESALHLFRSLAGARHAD